MKYIKYVLFLMISIVLFVVVDNVKVSAATNINKIEINYDTSSVRLSPYYTYNSVRNQFINAWSLPTEANYSKGNDNIWIGYCPSTERCTNYTLGYEENVLDRYTYVIFEVYAKPVGNNVSNPEFDFDENNLDDIEVWVNGVLRDDVIVQGYNEHWRQVDVLVPVAVNKEHFIKSVKIEEDGIYVQKGHMLQNGVEVKYYGDDYDETVTWSIGEHTSGDTKITGSGELTVGADETASTITIRAESVWDYTKYDEKTVNVIDDPISIDSVTVSPKTATVIRDYTKQFTVSVVGTAKHKVTWSVTGGTSEETKISDDGILTVGADETAEELTVTATSIFDNTKSDFATITVREHSEYINKIEINYDTSAVELNMNRTYKQARNDFKSSYTLPTGKHYSKGNDNIWMGYCPTKNRCTEGYTLGYGEKILFGRYTYMIAEIYADPFGNDVDNPEYDFDKDNLDAIEVWINGVKRTDAIVTDYNRNWREVDVLIPVEIGTVPFNATITGIKSKNYNGKYQTQSLTVTIDDKKLVEGTNYKVTYKNNKNAGTATVIIEGINGYGGTITKTFKINKINQSVKLSTNAVKFNKKKLKKKSLKAQVINISNYKGKITIKKLSGSKKLSIDNKGKITAKKKTKKGTYRINVKINATGDNNYNSYSKTISVKVKVK